MEVDASDIATPLKTFIKPIHESREIVELANQYKYLIGSQASQSNRLNYINSQVDRDQINSLSKDKLKIFVQEKNERNNQYNSLIKSADLVTKNIKANICIYKCDYCSETFSKTEDLNLHYMSCKTKIKTEAGNVHEGQKDGLKCDNCSSFFATARGLSKHTEYCDANKTIVDFHKCDCCNVYFETAHDLTKPAEYCNAYKTSIHEGQKDFYKCDVCNVYFETGLCLRTHLKHCTSTKANVHEGQKIYECEFCRSTFPTARGLIKHTENCAIKAKLDPKVHFKLRNQKIADVHKGNKYGHKCDFCSFSFTTTEDLKAHIKLCTATIIKDNKCKVCREVFPNFSELNIHVKEVHKGQNIIKKWEKIECPYCGKILVAEFGKHKNSCLGITRTKMSDYFCYICGQNFDSDSGIKRHMEIIHSNQHPIIDLDGKKHVDKQHTYSCDRCKTTFKGHRKFWAHMTEVHGGYKKFNYEDEKPTEVGDPKIQENNSVAVHEGFEFEYDVNEVETEIQPNAKPNLKKILLTVHEGQKTYSCLKCGEGFDKLEGIRQHIISTVHEESKNNVHENEKDESDQYKCNICGVISRSFGTLNERYNHLIVFHPRQSHHSSDNFVKVKENPKIVHEGNKNGEYLCNICDTQLQNIIKYGNNIEQNVISRSFQTYNECYNHLIVFHHCTLNASDNIINVKEVNKNSDSVEIMINIHDGKIEFDDTDDEEGEEVHEGPTTTFNCDFCDKTYKNNMKFRKHIIKVHKFCKYYSPKNNQHEGQNNLLLNTVHEEQKDYKCSMCGRIFPSFKGRNKHLREVHFSAPALEFPDDNLKKCPYCKKSVSSYAGHLNSCHTRLLEIYHAEQKDFSDHAVHEGQENQFLKTVHEGQSSLSANNVHEGRKILASTVHEGQQVMSSNTVHEGQKDKDYNCFMCGTIFSTFNGRSKHLQDVHSSVNNLKTMEYNLKSALEVPDNDLKKCPYCKKTVSSYAGHLQGCHSRLLKIYQGEQKGFSDHSVHEGQIDLTNTVHGGQNVLPNSEVHEGQKDLSNTVHEGQKETEIEESNDFTNPEDQMISNNEMYAIVKERGHSTRLQDYDLDIFKKTGKYKCLQCKEIYRNYNGLEGHLIQKHGGKKFKCDECGSVFNKFYILKDHRAKVHNMAMFSKYQFEGPCKVCGKEFKNEQFLKKHIQSEHENLQFQCDLCGKIFTFKPALITHTKSVHEGRERNQCCDKCGKSFTMKARLKMHIENVHEGLKRFKCQTCGKACSQSGDLKRHIKRFHKEES